MSRVAIIGGGFAGLSAAVALSARDVNVFLIERRRHLGGRACSFTDQTTGDTVDNGQHLLMKCFHHTRDFLTRIGTADRLHFQDHFRIDFRHPHTGQATLSFPRLLPPPLHLLVGFLRFGRIGFGDTVRLGRIANAMKAPQETDLTVNAWLNRCGQSPRIRQSFWDPLCTSALNQSPASAPASHLMAVLREAFFNGPEGSCLGYANVGLSALYTHAAHRAIEDRGGSVRLRAAATAVKGTPGGISIQLRSGECLTADACICAVPPPALARMLPDALAHLRNDLAAFRPSPILSVNLWFDRPVIEAKFIGMLGTRLDWIFNKPGLYENRDRASAGHIALVASAADALVHRSDDELVAIALEDLRALVPGAERARLRHHRVVRERHATFALPPGHPHPAARTDLPVLFLAGDWTDTGLPATIESAVTSGYRAAEGVLQYLKVNP